jgi:hypothetical protein
MRRALRRATLLATISAALLAAASTLAWAAFSSSQTASMSVASQSPFPATVAAYDIGDASAGSGEVVEDEPDAFTDGITDPSSGSFATSFSTTRYLDYRLSGPLATGLSVTSPSFDFDYASPSTARTVCFYFAVYDASSMTLLEAHGSSASPIACTASTTPVTTSTALTAVTTTDAADDLLVRVFVRSTAAGKINVDRAVVTGSTPSQSFTLYPNQISDCSASCGTPVVKVARLAAQDTTTYVSASAWATTFSTARYIRLGFPPPVPSAASVTSATLNLVLAANTSGRTLCVYVEVYSGATLLATHGSTTTPALCTSAATDTTLTLPLPEITTASQANTCQIKVYGKSNTSGKSVFDAATLAVGYSLT